MKALWSTFVAVVVFVAACAVVWFFWRTIELANIATIDWIIGIISFVWLIGIVTVPWNIHFQARDIVNEAQESRERGIEVQESDIAYGKRWMDWSLTLAVALHVLTACILLWVAWSGVSFLGYFGAAAAILLTFLRPIVRGYDYVSERLRSIQREIHYPREDVVSMRAKVEELERSVEELEQRFDVTREHSWAFEDAVWKTRHSEELERLRVAVDNLREMNKLEHERISRDAQNAMAQVLGDAAIVNHVREIIRFFKQA
jgi:hypothetical protein